MVSVANSLDNLNIMGSKLKANLRDAVTRCTLDMATSMVTELSIDIIDRDFGILGSGIFDLGNPVTYQDLKFIVAAVSTSTNAGNEQITIKARPKTVQDLKKRRGTKVMQDATPSQFVISECKAVGAKYHVQPSAKRSQVARDVPQAKQTYEEDAKPSSWTTFQRLASELGYIVFEQAGVIYFGKPTWLLKNGKESPLKVSWNGASATNAEQVPTCNKSLDATDGTTISVVLPPERANEARPGRVLSLSGVPKFNGNYLINSVNYDLAGKVNRMTVGASTAIDPVAQPPVDTLAFNESLSQSLSEYSSASWPLPTKYKVGTPFGQRGSWAAGFHTGADFPCPTGTPVYAVYDGKIVSGNWGSAYGTHILLQVGTKRYGYCHLSRKSVAVGQTVRAGQVIGYSGATGNVTGPHLHLELRYSPYNYNNICKDPIPTLQKTNVPSSATGGTSGGAPTSLLRVLQNAGFKGDALRVAAGIVWAESSNNAAAVGDTGLQTATWGPSIGIFQIRSLKKPQNYSGNDGKRIASKLYDAQYNANLAYAISNGGQNWSPWSTFTSGAYAAMLGRDGIIKNYGSPAGPVVNNLVPGHALNSYPVGRTNTKQASDFVSWCLSRSGDKYVFGATRDTSNVNQSTFDCSSLIRWAMARVGISFPTDTWTQEAWLKKGNGTKITLAAAYNIRGALLYRSTKGREHVAVSLGNGKTIEAVSSSLGVRQQSAAGRGWTAAYTVKSMKYNYATGKMVPIPN